MIDEQPVSFLSVLTMGTLSLGIVAFPEFASLRASLLYCHFRICPRRDFTSSWPIRFPNLQFSNLDQVLDLVFECIAIFYEVAWNPSMVVASNIDIVPSRKWGLERYQVNWYDEAIIY